MLPVHPILVHFPIALLTVSLAADALASVRVSTEARALGFWCLVLAAVGAAGAVMTGLVDMHRADLAMATHGYVHLHRDIGWVLLAVILLLAVWRLRIRRRSGPGGRVGRAYLASAAAAFTLLVFQGWFGGELVYGHGAGVAAASQGVVSPEQGQKGLAPFSRFTGHADPHGGHNH
ncbi:MAG: DUF2231 domain-containing protein [Rhodospirillales bacterium]|nr:DUF2231 domain-containing protein [Rhodospirillales bacterium]